MHWGLYSSTATHNEWDEKYIYGANSGIQDQFTTNFGPRDSFGYLDVLDPAKGPNATGAAAYTAAGSAYEPFTAANYNPTAWAALFQASGANMSPSAPSITMDSRSGIARSPPSTP